MSGNEIADQMGIAAPTVDKIIERHLYPQLGRSRAVLHLTDRSVGRPSRLS
jgi:hypothetical protein